MKIKKVNDKLINTWETLANIEIQYTDVDNDLSELSEMIVMYINNLPDFDKKVFYLYTEYNSYRKVSVETNVKKDLIMQTINRIRKDIKDKKYINSIDN